MQLILFTLIIGFVIDVEATFLELHTQNLIHAGG